MSSLEETRAALLVEESDLKTAQVGLDTLQQRVTDQCEHITDLEALVATQRGSIEDLEKRIDSLLRHQSVSSLSSLLHYDIQ